MASTSRHFSLGHRLPGFLSIPLFGDRQQYGQTPIPGDPCWQEWLDRYAEFYLTTQHSGVRKVVSYSGHKVMQQLELTGKRVVELGPGVIAHVPHWRGRPECYDVLDVNEQLLQQAAQVLIDNDVPHRTFLESRDGNPGLPFPSEEYDAVVSFYSLEHLHPLELHLAEIRRVLKPGGHLLGAIPCEGGLGWGLGRLLSTRRWLKKNSNIDPDKWICWEHPNFAESIMRLLDMTMTRTHVSYFPLLAPSIDLNLILRFVYQKTE